jgi:hypothetical protein
MFEREQLPDGSVCLKTAACSFHYRRLRPGVVHVTIVGDDKGEFGMAPLDELAAEIARFSKLDMFVDTRDTVGAATSVTEDWTAWFQANRAKLGSVHILATSKFVTLIVSIAKHLSRTGDMIHIHSTPDTFEAAVRKLVPDATVGTSAPGSRSPT